MGIASNISTLTKPKANGSIVAALRAERQVLMSMRNASSWEVWAQGATAIDPPDSSAESPIVAESVNPRLYPTERDCDETALCLGGIAPQLSAEMTVPI
jgi:hypothetical protein